jgi:hypothetical protein
MLPLRPAGRRRAQYAACIQVRHGKLDSEHADIDAALNMAPADQETEVAPPVEEPEEMPLPSNANVIFLGGLFVLALLATASVASEIVLPLVFAIILNLLLQPALRLLERFHVPRMLAALLLILALFGTIVGLGTAISGPAGTWAAKLPGAFLGFKSGWASCENPSIHCNGFCSRWKILEERDHRMRPPRREAQLF